MLSIKSGLITCGTRIIVPREMRPEILQYIHEGHQGKAHCLLWAKNTVFWPKITYDVQQLIEKCMICQEYGKSQPLIGAPQELPPFPWHTLATDMFYWKRIDFLMVADMFSRYIIVRKLPNSTSTAMYIGLSMTVTELGLPYIIRSDNSPCYSSKEFQQFLQCYSIMHPTSSPKHSRSNGFTERIVGVAKNLMDKAGSEGKLWISSLFDYRVTPPDRQHCITFATDDTAQIQGEKPSPTASALGAPEMHQIHQELIRRQESKPEREYQELLPGTPVWVQHRQTATWEAAVVVNQTDAPNSYWIMQENGAQQPKIYRHTKSFLKIRSTPTDGEAKAQMKEWMPEKENAEFYIPATPYGSRNPMVKNSQDRSSPSSLTPPLPTLDLPNSQNFSEMREEDSQLAEP